MRRRHAIAALGLMLVITAYRDGAVGVFRFGDVDDRHSLLIGVRAFAGCDYSPISGITGWPSRPSKVLPICGANGWLLTSALGILFSRFNSS